MLITVGGVNSACEECLNKKSSIKNAPNSTWNTNNNNNCYMFMERSQYLV